MILSVPNLLSELSDVDVYFLRGPTQGVGHEIDKSFGVLCAKELSKLANLFQMRVFGEGVQGKLRDRTLAWTSNVVVANGRDLPWNSIG